MCELRNGEEMFNIDFGGIVYILVLGFLKFCICWLNGILLVCYLYWLDFLFGGFLLFIELFGRLLFFNDNFDLFLFFVGNICRGFLLLLLIFDEVNNMFL